MDIRKIRKLIELINETGIAEIEIKSGDESVRISRTTASSALPAPVASTHAVETAPKPIIASKPGEAAAQTLETVDGHSVKSPMVGTVYLSSTPGAKPFVDVGQRVAMGDTLCLIEAMKMFNKIEADKGGVISARLVDNAQPVEYDQALFIIEPDE